MKKNKIHDISLSIYPGMLKWPDDPPIQFSSFASMARGDKVNLNLLIMGSHTGTHIDAPFHFQKKGKKIDTIPLDILVGQALVVQVSSGCISLKDVKNIDYNQYKRILFKTKNSRFLKKKKFRTDYVYLDYPAACFLVKKGVKVIGIDYLSIEKYGSADHKVHKILTRNNVIIIEGLDLSRIKPKDYLLMALPLKIKKGDGSPCRVALIEGVL
ncbi:MAG: cyclase family protein [Spirochaetes bacterium]|nr:cyclase family protein [Spirochaetota bacterium]